LDLKKRIDIPNLFKDLAKFKPGLFFVKQITAVKQITVIFIPFLVFAISPIYKILL